MEKEGEPSQSVFWWGVLCFNRETSTNFVPFLDACCALLHDQFVQDMIHDGMILRSCPIPSLATVKCPKEIVGLAMCLDFFVKIISIEWTLILAVNTKLTLIV